MRDASSRTTVYNYNKVAVDWAAACTHKGTKHINLCKNYVRELHQLGVAKITHIHGVINARDIFTKEIKDAAHVRRCHDSMMVSKQNFEKWSHVTPSHFLSKHDLPYYSIWSPHGPSGIHETRTSCVSSSTLCVFGQKVYPPFLPVSLQTGGVDVPRMHIVPHHTSLGPSESLPSLHVP
jgi:hypothetical protein